MCTANACAPIGPICYCDLRCTSIGPICVLRHDVCIDRDMCTATRVHQ